MERLATSKAVERLRGRSEARGGAFFPEHWLKAMGAAMLLRDAGAPLMAERYLHELRVLYGLNPLRVAGALVERDNSIDFHEWTPYATKIGLARALARYAAAKSGALAHPETYLLPDDRPSLAAATAGDIGATWIAKPHRGAGGQGIVVTRDIQPFLSRDDVVVQRYIERPFLVDGRKGHIRIYGLVAVTHRGAAQAGARRLGAGPAGQWADVPFDTRNELRLRVRRFDAGRASRAARQGQERAGRTGSGNRNRPQRPVRAVGVKISGDEDESARQRQFRRRVTERRDNGRRAVGVG
jgi:hypothetical protein